MHNWRSLENGEGVANFGFPVATSCGSIAQDNSWTDDWVEFFCRKIDSQLDRLASGSSSKVRVKCGNVIVCQKLHCDKFTK